jgi:hypothetical protein
MANITAGLQMLSLRHLDDLVTMTMETPGQSNLALGLNLSGAIVHAAVWYEVQPLNDMLSGPPLRESASAAFRLNDLLADVDVRADFSWPCLAALTPLEETTSGCVAACIDTLTLLQIRPTLAADNITLTPMSGASDVDGSLDAMLSVLAGQYANIWTMLLSGVSNGPMLDAINVALADHLASLPNCNTSPPQSWLPSEIAAPACGMLLLIMWISTLCSCGRRRRRKDKAALSADASSSAAAATSVNDDDDDDDLPAAPLLISSTAREASADLAPASTTCLAAAAEVPLIWALVMPLLLAGTAWLLVASYTRISAEAIPTIITNGTRVDLGVVKALKYTTTVRDMWDAGVYPLSVFIVVFSGVLPCAKLLFLMLAWAAPTSWLSVSWRESLLVVSNSNMLMFLTLDIQILSLVHIFLLRLEVSWMDKNCSFKTPVFPPHHFFFSSWTPLASGVCSTFTSA